MLDSHFIYTVGKEMEEDTANATVAIANFSVRLSESLEHLSDSICEQNKGMDTRMADMCELMERIAVALEAKS